MNVKLSAPKEMLYCGHADTVKLRTTVGDVQILPGHAPYLAEIGKGKLEIRAGQDVITGETSAGILYNHQDEISMILFEPYQFMKRTDA